MQRSFDPVAFAEYVRQRWRFLGSICGIAIALTLAISLILPKRYTAKASLLIDDPAGNDARAATAVSPVYLESLKSYEYFAASDSLFRTALDRFHLRTSDGSSIESLKRRVLAVSKLRDTRILEIRATLRDPKLAQALVQFLAEETVKLNQVLAQTANREASGEAQQQQTAAKQELDRLQTAWSDLSLQEPVATVQADIAALVELRGRIREEILQARVDIADSEQRQTQHPEWKSELAASRARLDVLEKQDVQAARELQQKNKTLVQRSMSRQSLESQLKAAQAAFDAASLRVQEVRGSSSFRGERLRIVDPGIVPERPSFPNIPLNVLIAMMAALLVSIVYLGIAFQNRPHVPRPHLQAAVKHSSG